MSANQRILYHNATVHTVDDRLPRADWFVVLGDRFSRVGAGAPPTFAPEHRVDLQGRTVVPGFVDAHAHFFQTGVDALHIDLSRAPTVAEVLERLRAQAPEGARTWIFAHSFEEDALTDAASLLRDDLDRLSAERPIWVNRIDYHSAVVNTAALRRLDIPAETPGLQLGGDGRPTGVLRSNAYFHGKTQVSRLYTLQTKDRAIRTCARQMVRKGITAVHALEGGRIFGDEGAHQVLRRMDSLPVDVTVFLQEKNVFFTKQLGFERLGGCILIDGSIGSYTAALDQDYEGLKGARGVLYEKPRELFAFVDRANRAGIQLAFHAIGPRAIELILSAYERALDRTPRYDHRHRIEHFEMATDDQIRRAAALGIVASMQPAFEHFWGGPDGMYAARLGERWRQTNRLRTILEAGMVIAGGSDTNVTPADPLLGIHAAVNHPNPAQRVRPDQALRMMTLDAAHAAFNDKRHGSISAGKEASFVVLAADPLQVPAADIAAIGVEETWSRGRRVSPAAPNQQRAAGIGEP